MHTRLEKEIESLIKQLQATDKWLEYINEREEIAAKQEINPLAIAFYTKNFNSNRLPDGVNQYSSINASHIKKKKSN